MRVAIPTVFAFVSTVCCAQTVRTPLFALEMPKGWTQTAEKSSNKSFVALVSTKEDVEASVTGVSAGPEADLEAIVRRYVSDMQRIERGPGVTPTVTEVSKHEREWRADLRGRYPSGGGYRHVGIAAPGNLLSFDALSRTRTDAEIAAALDDVIRAAKY